MYVITHSSFYQLSIHMHQMCEVSCQSMWIDVVCDPLDEVIGRLAKCVCLC